MNYQPTRLLSRLSLRSGLCLVILCGAALRGHSVPASGRLLMDDGSLHASMWRRVYAVMPSVWRARRTIVVREVTDAQMDRLVHDTTGGQSRSDDNSVIDGCYLDGGPNEDDPASITLRQSLRGYAVALVFTHEYGHYVWDDLLTDGQRGAYRRLWQAQKRRHQLVTEYAADSYEEGFAEAFAYFLRRPDVLQRRDAASAAFLRDVLGAAGQQQLTADGNACPG